MMMKYNPWAFNRFLPDGYDGEFDWDYLKKCWGGKREPMDFDCVVEKAGEFLVIETKGPEGFLTDGHKWLFCHLVSDPKWTLMVVYGKLPEEVSKLVVIRQGRVVKRISPATKADVIRECQAWANQRTPKQPRYYGELKFD